MLSKLLRGLVLIPLAALLSGCDIVMLHPSGDIAVQQRNLILISTGLMLTIVIPVIVLTLFFAWRYRDSNKAAVYWPDWYHSTGLELVIWSAPLAIIIALGAITWTSTHVLDPYRSIDRVGPGQPVPSDSLPIDVVALDWKWLFIYPNQGIATVNELALPVNTPIEFRVTSTSVMNSFFIPAVAGQIYAMPGMQTQLHAVLNHQGVFDGFSANFSGDGFSGMHFRVLGQDDGHFSDWVRSVRSRGGRLERPDYLMLERPSENEPAHYYSTVAKDLFPAIVNMCVDPAKMCSSDMMHIDARGGLGVAGLTNVAMLTYDKLLRRGGEPVSKPYVRAICSPAGSPLKTVDQIPEAPPSAVQAISASITPASAEARVVR